MSGVSKLEELSAAVLEAVKPRYAVNSLAIHRAGLQRLAAFCAESGILGAAEIDDEAASSIELW